MIGRAIASPDSAQAMKISAVMCRSSVVSLNPGSAVAVQLQRGDIHGSGAGHTPQRDQPRLFSAQLGEVRRTPHGAEAIGACGAQVDGAKAGVLGGGQRLHGLLRWLTTGQCIATGCGSQ